MSSTADETTEARIETKAFKNCPDEFNVFSEQFDAEKALRARRGTVPLPLPNVRPFVSLEQCRPLLPRSDENFRAPQVAKNAREGDADTDGMPSTSTSASAPSGVRDRTHLRKRAAEWKPLPEPAPSERTRSHRLNNIMSGVEHKGGPMMKAMLRHVDTQTPITVYVRRTSSEKRGQDGGANEMKVYVGIPVVFDRSLNIVLRDVREAQDPNAPTSGDANEAAATSTTAASTSTSTSSKYLRPLASSSLLTADNSDKQELLVRGQHVVRVQLNERLLHS